MSRIPKLGNVGHGNKPASQAGHGNKPASQAEAAKNR